MTIYRLIFTLLSIGMSLGCDSARQTPPPVQPSSPEAASSLVHVQSGAPFTPACLIVDLGATVEWRNLSPRTSTVVLSVSDPYELSSPALRSPYNFVPPEASDECSQRVSGQCITPEPFSFWRHTFGAPGIFDYHDTNGTSASNASTSDGDEYGLPVGTPGTSGGVGTVCVRGQAGDCQQVCCTGTTAGECANGVSCVSGRCGGVQL